MALSATVNTLGQMAQSANDGTLGISLYLPMDPGKLQTRKQQFVRTEIWDAAIDLFAEKGFDETTIEEIAEAAGVSRRTFFRYFSSKDDLMVQGILTYGTMLTEAISICPATCSPMEVMRRTVLSIAKTVAARPQARKVMRIASRSAAARGAQISRYADVEEQVAHAFAARLGKKDELTPRLLGGLTLWILDITFRVWHKQGHKDIAPIVERVFSTLSRLQAGPAGERDRFPRIAG